VRRVAHRETPDRAVRGFVAVGQDDGVHQTGALEVVLAA
jgi:hypothetical protein